MAFKLSDMHDVGKVSDIGVVPKQPKKKWYPTVHLDEKVLAALKKLNFKDKVTLHAHGEISGQVKYDDQPTEYTIELQKVGIKPGHNPRAKWMTDTDYKKFEECLGDLKGGHGVNRYAVCMASVKKGHEKRKRVLKKLK